MDRLLAAADRTASTRDQSASDADQVRSASDQTDAVWDQLASDRDQAVANAVHAALENPTSAQRTAFARSRFERLKATLNRRQHRLERGAAAGARTQEAALRDRIADARDQAANERDEHASELARGAAHREASLLKQLDDLRTQAAAERDRASEERARSAAERVNFDAERERFEAELRSTHLDDLTGAYRRGVGRTAIAQEIARARRADGRFVLAFVDVDGLKAVNDRDGHAAGDHVLETIVRTIRTSLRSFDPIVRYGGDEFVCGLAGIDVVEAERRFDAIRGALGTAGVAISVGLAVLTETDTADVLTARADAAMLEVKAQRHRPGGHPPSGPPRDTQLLPA